MRYRAISCLLAGMLAGCAAAGPDATPAPRISVQKIAPAEPQSAKPVADYGYWSEDDSPLVVCSLDPQWGARDALVTVVVFAEVQSPWTAGLVTALKKLRDVYPPDRVRIVWKHMVLERMHPEGMVPAEAARGAFELGGNEAFWRFLERATANQDSLNRESFVAWAKEAGVGDLARYQRGLDSRIWAGKVQQDGELARRAGIDGAPTTFVNGAEIMGAARVETLAAQIESELPKAEELLNKGTSRREVHVLRTRANRFSGEERPRFRSLDDVAAGDDTPPGPVFRVPVAGGAVRGPRNAPVTIVAFINVDTTTCADALRELDWARETWGDNVRMVLRHHWDVLPRTNDRDRALFINAARELGGDEAAWKAATAICVDRADTSRAGLDKLATELGLDKRKLRTAMTAKARKQELEADLLLGDTYEVDSPTWFINGRRMPRKSSPALVRRRVDEELNAARVMKRSGVAPEAIYDRIMERALTDAGRAPFTAPPPARAPAIGPANAKLTLQLFAPTSSLFNPEVLDDLQQAMAPHAGKVRLVWRFAPRLGVGAIDEAAWEAFAQAGSSGFFRFVRKIAGASVYDRAGVEVLGKTLGLDTKRLASALDAHTHSPAIAADQALFPKSGSREEYVLVVGDRVIPGLPRVLTVRRAIEDALKRQASAP